MFIDLQDKRFEKIIKNSFPILAYLENDGLTVKEVSDQLKKFFKVSGKPEIMLENDFGARLYWVSNIFKDWLKLEKKLSDERIYKICQPLFDSLAEHIKEKIEDKEKGNEAKILRFPGKIK